MVGLFALHQHRVSSAEVVGYLLFYMVTASVLSIFKWLHFMVCGFIPPNAESLRDTVLLMLASFILFGPYGLSREPFINIATIPFMRLGFAEIANFFIRSPRE